MSLKEQVINWASQLDRAISHHEIAEAFAISLRRASYILHRVRHEAESDCYYNVDVMRQKRPDTGHWITKLKIRKHTLPTHRHQEFKLEEFIKNRETSKSTEAQISGFSD
ncbi:CaiF/GrlA family transcriptional regulator [Photobacterium sp. SDRW27]|uniref:CaiF/GrlA family transcriptional regulator n=1 Tax=Photobacterium obscurum TaxID=2829490 RepID=UPI00224499EC|nr:CaiF/GrlA family transcriptional regulator [Photobacterium obscurum]MCW8331627.1 CaiF/GrlA family transcriptional regulator [Photobacterium obscurum]